MRLKAPAPAGAGNQRDGLLAEHEDGENAETFGEGAENEGEGEDLALGLGVAADGLNGAEADQTDGESGAENGETGGDVTSDHGV